MKNMTKNIFLFFGFIVLFLFIFKIPNANALTISEMCLTINATVNVPSNLPSNTSVFVGCNGDGGYPPTGLQKTTDSSHYGVCLGNCPGPGGCDLSGINLSSSYIGPLDWCKGDIEQVINGRATL